MRALASPCSLISSCGEALAEGRLEAVMPGWKPPPIALNLVMPPGGPRPARVEVLASFLAKRLGA